MFRYGDFSKFRNDGPKNNFFLQDLKSSAISRENTKFTFYI